MTSVADRRPVSAIGRDARLELAFENRRGRTILTRAYAEPPYRIGHAFELDAAAYVIVVCAGPGVFAGDTLRQTVHLAPGARAVLTSQSALQVHPSAAAAPARIHHEYRVDDDAELHCHWDALLPFADARIEQRFHLQLAPTARLYWSDAVMAGRVSRGEAWRFTELAHELTLRVGASLEYLERYRLRPSFREPTHEWIAGRASYLATALVRSPRATAGAVESLHRQVAAVPDVSAAVDMVEASLVLGRIAAVAGPPFVAARNTFRQLALDSIFAGANLVGRK